MIANATRSTIFQPSAMKISHTRTTRSKGKVLDKKRNREPSSSEADQN